MKRIAKIITNTMKKIIAFCQSKPAVLIQAASLSVIVLGSVFRLVTGAPFRPEWLLFDFSLATTLIMLLPWPEDSSRVLLSLSLSVLGVAVLLSLSGNLLPAPMLRILYILAVTLPLPIRLAERVRRLTADKGYLTAQWSGWEFLQIQLNLVQNVAFLFWFALASHWVTLADSPWMDLPAVLISVVLYLFLLFRAHLHKPVPPEEAGDIAFARSHGYPAGVLSGSRQYKRLYKAMCMLLEERRPYLRSNYTVQDMARELGTNRAYLSHMINQTTGLNFSQLMNKYRILSALELIKKNPTIQTEEAALLSGFNNKVTFGLAFKLFLNCTMKEWRHRYMESLDPEQRSAILSRPKAKKRKSPSGRAAQDARNGCSVPAN